MKKVYLALIIFIFVLSVFINLIFGQDRLLPLIIAIVSVWSNVDNLNDFLNFNQPYTGIAVVKTVLADEDITERKKSFHTDLFFWGFFSLLFAFK